MCCSVGFTWAKYRAAACRVRVRDEGQEGKGKKRQRRWGGTEWRRRSVCWVKWQRWARTCMSSAEWHTFAYCFRNVERHRDSRDGLTHTVIHGQVLVCEEDLQGPIDIFFWFSLWFEVDGTYLESRWCHDSLATFESLCFQCCQSVIIKFHPSWRSR